MYSLAAWLRLRSSVSVVDVVTQCCRAAFQSITLQIGGKRSLLSFVVISIGWGIEWSSGSVAESCGWKFKCIPRFLCLEDIQLHYPLVHNDWEKDSAEMWRGCWQSGVSNIRTRDYRRVYYRTNTTLLLDKLRGLDWERRTRTTNCTAWRFRFINFVDIGTLTEPKFTSWH